MDHRVAGHQQHRSTGGLRQAHAHLHARHQPAGGVGQFHPCPHSTCHGVHLGQEALHPAFENLARCAGAGYLYPRSRLQQRGLTLRHRTFGPDGTGALQAHQQCTGHDGGAFAHRQLTDHAAAGRGDCVALLHGACGHHAFDVGARHARLTHALKCCVLQCVAVQSAQALKGQVLFLSGHPVGHMEFGQWRASGHAVQHRAHMQFFHETHGARAHHCLLVFVPGHVAYDAHFRRQRTFQHRGGAQAQVLLDARAHRDAACVCSVATGVARHQHHVHERRLGGRVEVSARHHGVVVVQDAQPGGRIQVAGLESIVYVPARGRFALRNGPLGRIVVGGCGLHLWCTGLHGVAQALLHAQPPGAGAHCGQDGESTQRNQNGSGCHGRAPAWALGAKVVKGVRNSSRAHRPAVSRSSVMRSNASESASRRACSTAPRGSRPPR